MYSRRAFSRAAAAALVSGACRPTEQPHGAPVRHPGDRVRFAAIGDYGAPDGGAAGVAELVRRWDPDLVVTLGDNNYPQGRATSLDDNVGQHYHDFIGSYAGRYGAGADVNRFFPTLGNHDWRTPGVWPFHDYFDLPGNERYYDARWGPVHLFALDSDPAEPDGNEATSEQATWLRERLARSDAPWRVVYFHHPPFSSGRHGSSRPMQWPFAQWGASLVLSGHDHLYERHDVDGTPYVINGLGGHPNRYAFRTRLPTSRVRFNEDFGALRVEASRTRLELSFATIAGTEVDRIVLGT